MKTPVLLFSISFAAVLSGCHSASHESKPAELVMSVETAPIDPVQAAAARTPSPTPQPSPYAGEAVYRQPVLRRIFLEPYKDENGNAYGPQVKYVMDDPGGWNMEALRNPAKAYIPPAMSPSMSQPGSVDAANTGELPQMQPTKTIRDLYKLDTLIVTGFMERSQQPLAEEQARLLASKGQGNYVVIPDEDLGFLLVPQSELQPLSAH